MAGQILDGKALAATVQTEIAAAVAEQVQRGGPRPGLAAVRVGDDPGSEIYVRNKIKACEKAGFVSFHHHLPATTPQTVLLELIGRLNRDTGVHGILVQLPLPKHIDKAAVVHSVLPQKDVDGFHPENLGLLAAETPRFVPCTPLGVQQLLVRNGIEIAGAHVVILGRSQIVGKPLALLLLQKGAGGDATVTIAHSRTRHLMEVTRSADILVAAMGQPGFVRAEMVRPGTVVIDVGISRVDGKIRGDVDFVSVEPLSRAITPVPGGVGPMTIAMLLHNTLQASKLT